MTTTIAIKRFLLYLKTFRFGAGMLVCLSIIGVGGFASIQDLQQKSDYCQAIELEQQRKLSEAKDYNQISGVLVMKPSALSLFSEGIGERYGLGAKTSGSAGPVEVFGRTNANPFLLAFRSLDLAHIVGLLLTLMAVLFTYDAVSGERESGMLRLTLANSLPRYKFILGEYLGALLSILLPLLSCFLLWLLLIHVYGGIVLAPEDWMRLWLLFASSILMVSLFAMLGIMVSCLTHQASTSVILGLFFWIFLGTLYPDLSSWAATKIAPISPGASSELEPNRAVAEAYLSKSEIREMMTLPPEQMRARAEELERQSQARFSQFVASTETEKDLELRQMVSQAKLAELLQNLSPISAYMQLTSILAGTDLGSYVRFRTQARQLNHEMAKWREEKMKKYPQAAGAFGAPLDLSDLPRLSFGQETLAESVSKIIPLGLTILAFHILCFLVALLAFTRYDVR